MEGFRKAIGEEIENHETTADLFNMLWHGDEVVQLLEPQNPHPTMAPTSHAHRASITFSCTQ